MGKRFLDNVTRMLGLDDQMEDEHIERPEDFEEEEVAAPRSSKTKPTLISLPTANGVKTKIVLTEPETYDEVTEMVAHLKAKQVVIVNLENAEPDVARQIIDFLSGAVYALEGSMRKIKEFVFVVSPNTVEITAEIKRELQERTNPFWGR